jgi:hypothetical protein
MIAPSIVVTDLLLHVEIEKRETEAVRPTAAIERELQQCPIFNSLTNIF